MTESSRDSTRLGPPSAPNSSRKSLSSTHAALDAAVALRGSAPCRASERKRHMNTNKQYCVGSIRLVYADTTSNEVVTLGGAGFINREEDDAAWANVPAFASATNLVADRLDANGDIVDDKPVSVETCEILMGAPIDQLISAGRAQLARELASA